MGFSRDAQVSEHRSQQLQCESLVAPWHVGSSARD